MGKVVQIVSDLSGEPIEEKDSARLNVHIGEQTFVLDVKKSEALELAKKGRETKRRGRKPKAA